MVIDVAQTSALDLDAGMANWQNFPASTISHHGRACCEVAREWILGMDFSQLNGGNPLTGPRWLRQKFKWGPSTWPIPWCEAVQQKTLDCGALAALSHQLFLGRGVWSFPAQLILEFNDASTRHWQETWAGDGACVHWISEGLIYHEGCAVRVAGGEIKLWDATATWWVNPKQFGGYAGLLALRVFNADASQDPEFTWGPHTIPANIWQKVARAQSDFGAREPARKPRIQRGARAKKAVAPPTLV